MTALSLPEEFVLLLHKPTNGSYYVTGDNTPAAEIAELVLQHRLVLEDKKLRVLNSEATGMAWADEIVADVVKRAGAKEKPVDVSTVMGNRRSAMKTHRAALVEHGLMEHKPKKFLGMIPDDRYFPDETVRDGLISEIRQVVRVDRPIDNRLALLCALVHVSGLAERLGFDKDEQAMLKSISKGENLGEAVEDVVAMTTVMLTTTVMVTVVAGSE